MSELYANYIRDVVYMIRERAAQAMKENQSKPSALNEGRELAFREVLSVMQNQADVFQIPREAVCLDGFDPLSGRVDPPEPQSRDEEGHVS